MRVVKNEACSGFHAHLGVGLAMPLRRSSRRAVLDDPTQTKFFNDPRNEVTAALTVAELFTVPAKTG